MLFSHISDTHLGFVQYYSDEREQDVYDAFDQAIDLSISDHVDFVIFAGDIFHVPNPSGKAILVLANALKRLKQRNIDSFFILGEHDISRIRSTPIPFVYHNLDFSKYMGNGKPFRYKDVLLVGYDKRRKNEIHTFEKDFAQATSEAKNHSGHKILILHQGMTEINKFAGELSSADLPKNFTYYAMGHLHEKEIKKFNNLGGPLAYPGSIELTSSEGIKETQKGFIQVDISSAEAKPTWIKLETRQQFSIDVNFENLKNETDLILQKMQSIKRRPILELKIHGEKIEPTVIQSHLAKIYPYVLRCFWKEIAKNEDLGTTYFERPTKIDDEMLKIAKDILHSEHFANLAIKELLPLFSAQKLEEVNNLVTENFVHYKKEKRNC